MSYYPKMVNDIEKNMKTMTLLLAIMLISYGSYEFFDDSQDSLSEQNSIELVIVGIIFAIIRFVLLRSK